MMASSLNRHRDGLHELFPYTRSSLQKGGRELLLRRLPQDTMLRPLTFTRLFRQREFELG